MAWYSNLFSGGSSGSGGFDWTGAILAGVSAYSSSRNSSKGNKADIAAQGLEGRKTIAFEKELDHYYKQKDNLNKRNALDTYGAFSKLSSFAPAGYVSPAKPVVPTKPSP